MEEQIERKGQSVEPQPKPLPKPEPKKKLLPPDKPIKQGKDYLTD